MSEVAHFTAVDYIVLAVVFAVSVGIGVYHAVRGNRTTEEFLLANRSLSPLPVACSLIVSFLSSVSILGYSSEAYAYGLQMFWMIGGVICGLLFTIHVVVPVFYDLKMGSINEYIMKRYKSPFLKYVMLLLACKIQLLTLGIILYAPTLAMAAVTPISSETYILITGAVVTLYCSIGGMKAVVWTDLFQMIVLLSGVIVITCSSIVKGGGLVNVFKVASENGRLDALNFSFGLHERHTVINAIIFGMVSFGYTFSFSQASVQRITTQPSLRHAQGILYATLVGQIILLTLIFLGGIGIYAVYHGCDPISLGVIKKRDQILPLYVMQHLHFLTGVPGLFIACLFSGTVSSISSALNAVPTMLWNDFLVDFLYFQRASERTKTVFNKLLTAGLGLAMIGLAFLSSRTRGVVQAVFTAGSIAGGPAAGVFLMGLGLPFVGKKGAIAGLFISICTMSWIVIGAQFYGEVTPMLPLHAHLCQNASLTPGPNVTTLEISLLMPDAQKPHPLWFLYNISYTYFAFIGILICVTVGVVVTWATGCENLATVKPELVVRSLRRRVGSSDADDSVEVESFISKASDSEKV